jgi:hypothetical protein
MEKTTASRVTLFNQLFLSLLRPNGTTVAMMRDKYDRRWGRLPKELMKQLKDGGKTKKKKKAFHFSPLFLTFLPPPSLS